MLFAKADKTICGESVTTHTLLKKREVANGVKKNKHPTNPFFQRYIMRPRSSNQSFHDILASE